MTRGARISAVTVGLAFGFLLTASGLGGYTTIHRGLLFEDAYMFQVLGSAMAVATVGLALLRRRGTTLFGGRLALPRRPVERRHVYGGAVFGVGFGLAGACPGTAIAMAATGGLGGLVVLAGLVGGLRLRGAVEHRGHRDAPGTVPDETPVPAAAD